MERWSSRLGALMALIGGAVGLGNFLRFPFQAAKWGGGAFLILYLIALLIVGLPMVWIEMALGQAGGKQGYQSAPALLHSTAGKRGWLIGLMGVYVSLGVAAYYAYLTGWTLGYAYHALVGTFKDMRLEEVRSFFPAFLKEEAVYAWIGVWGLTAIVLRQGLRAGLEKVNLWGMPLLFLLGVGIAIGAIALGATGVCDTCDSHKGIAYLYLPRWEALSQPAVWLAAAGQVFFSIGVGFAMYPVYAASTTNLSVVREGTLTVAANTFAEVVLGGLIIVPITTAFLGLPYVKEQAGFGLGFAVMPYVLGQWGGNILIFAWYLLLFLAAFSSHLAMGWVAMTWLAETLGGTPQRWTWLFIGIGLLMGLPIVIDAGGDLLNLYDYWVGTLFLVLAALGHWWVFVSYAPHTLKLPSFLQIVLRRITPIFLILLLIGSFFQPEGGDWIRAWKHLLQEGSWLWAEDALPIWFARKAFATPLHAVGWFMLLGSAVLLLFLRKRE
ncbi:MAG: sodium-dependent transporter [Bacteroidia bacterium]|nr:sodium-dependent transporter [Bacteroidia bacterium]MDW8235511.1 sodium-dependent transporter [Bacteroidia bacterium]